MEKETLDEAADRLADAALHELGPHTLDEDSLDATDEYADLHEFAGCYPWLDGIVRSHPHDAAILASLRGEMTEPDAN